MCGLTCCLYISEPLTSQSFLEETWRITKIWYCSCTVKDKLTQRVKCRAFLRNWYRRKSSTILSFHRICSLDVKVLETQGFSPLKCKVQEQLPKKELARMCEPSELFRQCILLTKPMRFKLSWSYWIASQEAQEPRSVLLSRSKCDVWPSHTVFFFFPHPNLSRLSWPTAWKRICPLHLQQALKTGFCQRILPLCVFINILFFVSCKTSNHQLPS